MTATREPGPDPTMSEAQWRALVEGVLKGRPFEALASPTADGFAIEPLYRAAEHPPTIPFGEARPWRIASRIDHPEPRVANRLARAELAGGADSLVLVLQGGAGAHGFGLDLRTLDDLDVLLDGIDPSAVTLRAEPGPDGRRLAKAVLALAGRRGAALDGWRLDLGLDPLGTFAATGRLAAEWPEIARRLGETFKALREKGFGGRAFTADGRPYADAGASPAQELAAVLATGTTLLRGLEAQGVPLDQARNSLTFTLTADADLLIAVAKLRALRLLWGAVERACGLAPEPLDLHVETAWRIMARLDPHTNLIRTALAAFAAVVGGADSLAVLPFTAALGLPDEQARRIARNTNHLLASEAHLWRVRDPMAGAGAFETVTGELAATAWAEFQRIEGEGGLPASLTAGTVQARIATALASRTERIAAGLTPLVGVTLFPNPVEEPVSLLPVAPRSPRRGPRFPDLGPDLPTGEGAMTCDPLPSGRDSEIAEGGGR